MVAYNTKYYRRNKEKRFKVHKCPHCTFETTGPKSCLQAHVWAKHTKEKDRPFQCPCHGCSRGYSARANLHKHMKQCHNIIIPKDKNVIAYVVTPNIPDNTQNEITNDQQDRINFYERNQIIPKNMKRFSNTINQETLYHDLSLRIINICRYTKQDILNLKQ